MILAIEARMILAIDPGPTDSAFVTFDGVRPIRFEKLRNTELLDSIVLAHRKTIAHLAIEMIASYGMPVGAEVFNTCVWIGRFVQAWGGDYTLVFRRDVKLHLCGSVRAKDSNVRTAVLDRYGGKEKAIGRKANPGPLYGLSADTWSALAVALTWSDTHKRGAL